jgi:hypothetical protein
MIVMPRNLTSRLRPTLLFSWLIFSLSFRLLAAA